MKHSQLNTHHPTYNPAALRRIDLLYTGGQEIIDNANVFIQRDPGEHPDQYKSRLNAAHYDNYLAEIINGYVAQACSKQLSITTTNNDALSGFYSDFWQNADLSNNSFSQVAKCVFTTGLKYQTGYLGIDFPKTTKKPESLLEEEQSGANRAYVYEIPPENVIDWELDEFGNYIWLKIKDEYIVRDNPFAEQRTRVIRIKLLERAAKTNYTIYELRLPERKKPQASDSYQVVDSNTLSFDQIPVVRFSLPPELFISGLISANCASVFTRKSSLYAAEKKNLFPIAVFKQGPEITAAEYNEKQADPNRISTAKADVKTKNVAVIGSSDSLEYVEPSGKSYEIFFDQIQKDVDEIHRVTHTMANSISNADKTYKAALAKIEDNKAKELVLSAYGETFRDFAGKVYDLIAQGRGEKIQWKITGMDEYRILDRQQTLNELQLHGDIPSKTLKKITFARLATELEPELTHEQLQQITDEIDAAVNKVPDSPNPQDQQPQQQAPQQTPKQQPPKKKNEVINEL